jgi:hypothetical protein
VTLCEYRISELQQLVLTENEFWNAPQLPITRHRTLSQVHNPRAQSDDVVLWVAKDEDRTIGYLGVVPDKIFCPTGEVRIGWLTGWWADPDARYRGTGLLLMSKALQFYRGQVGASDFTSDAERVYVACRQFRIVKELGGVSLLLALSAEQLKRKRPNLAKRWWPLARLGESTIRTIIAPRILAWKARNKISPQYSIEYVNQIDASTAAWIKSCQAQELCRRGPDDFDWILRYPWVLSAPLNGTENQRYFFSATVRAFTFIAYKVLDRATARVVGFVLLNYNSGHLQVPYCYLNPSDADLVFRSIALHAIELKADRLTLFQPELIEAQRKIKLPSLQIRSVTRKWALGNPLVELLPASYRFQPGDGDCVFT